jgi:hypothetical protein
MQQGSECSKHRGLRIALCQCICGLWHVSIDVLSLHWDSWAYMGSSAGLADSPLGV